MMASTPQVKLTEDEKALAIKEEMERDGKMRDYSDIIQNALLKKLVGWLESKEAVAHPTKDMLFAIYREQWQSLLKEVEDATD